MKTIGTGTGALSAASGQRAILTVFVILVLGASAPFLGAQGRRGGGRSGEGSAARAADTPVPSNPWGAAQSRDPFTFASPPAVPAVPGAAKGTDRAPAEDSAPIPRKAPVTLGDLMRGEDSGASSGPRATSQAGGRSTGPRGSGSAPPAGGSPGIASSAPSWSASPIPRPYSRLPLPGAGATPGAVFRSAEQRGYEVERNMVDRIAGISSALGVAPGTFDPNPSGGW